MAAKTHRCIRCRNKRYRPTRVLGLYNSLGFRNPESFEAKRVGPSAILRMRRAQNSHKPTATFKERAQYLATTRAMEAKFAQLTKLRRLLQAGHLQGAAKSAKSTPGLFTWRCQVFCVHEEGGNAVETTGISRKHSPDCQEFPCCWPGQNSFEAFRRWKKHTEKSTEA